LLLRVIVGIASHGHARRMALVSLRRVEQFTRFLTAHLPRLTLIVPRLALAGLLIRIAAGRAAGRLARALRRLIALRTAGTGRR
jgi:hypothetical protein